RRSPSSSGPSRSSANTRASASRSCTPPASTGRACTGMTTATASAVWARSSCCSMTPRCTGCRPTPCRRRATCRRCGARPPRPPPFSPRPVWRPSSDDGRAAMKSGEQSMVPKADVRTYYDRPVLKEPVWKWYIPAYFFTGGLAGASSVLGLGAQLTRRPALRRASRVAALGGISASAVLLVVDLGRPSRFHHMLRVLKVTSPMSVGSWLLAAYGPAAGAAAVPEVIGLFPRLGAAAGVVAGILGPAVTTYTAVLVSDTAIPAWHEAHAQLPFVFAGGAAASAGGLAVICTPVGEAGPARRLALMG